MERSKKAVPIIAATHEFSYPCADFSEPLPLAAIDADRPVMTAPDPNRLAPDRFFGRQGIDTGLRWRFDRHQRDGPRRRSRNQEQNDRNAFREKA